MSDYLWLWTVAQQAPLSMGFSKQEYWSAFPFSVSRESSQPRDWTWVSCVSTLAGGFFTTVAPGQSMGRKELDMTKWLFLTQHKAIINSKKGKLNLLTFSNLYGRWAQNFHWKLVLINQSANIYHMLTVCKALWAQRFHAGFHDPVVPVLCPSIIGNNYSQYLGILCYLSQLCLTPLYSGVAS